MKCSDETTEFILHHWEEIGRVLTAVEVSLALSPFLWISRSPAAVWFLPLTTGSALLIQGAWYSFLDESLAEKVSRLQRQLGAIPLRDRRRRRLS